MCNLGKIWRVMPLLLWRAPMWMLEKGVRRVEWRMRYSKREKDGKEEGGTYRESEKKLQLCQQIRFGFGSPVHHITPNWNRLGGDLKGPQGWFCSTYSATRPPNRQTKLDFVLSHTACRSKLRQRTWCWRKQGCDVARRVRRGEKNYIKEIGTSGNKSWWNPRRFYAIARTWKILRLTAAAQFTCIWS